ncbi:MAG: methyltransferase protein [Marmoricola sp.]|nr:methyltransferase protein [Marmoricola sp.]
MTAVTVFGARSFTTVYSAALRGEACHVVGPGESRRPLPVAAWTRYADAGDRALLGHCVGPTLDIGCGPGRMTQFLAQTGHAALGIDVVPEAVAQTRDRGVSALVRDVFQPVPGEGRWATALLADGNIGIGGDPRSLLTRVVELIEPGGRVVVDLEPPGSGVQTRRVRLETRSGRSHPFQWTIVGSDAIGLVAAGTGLRVASVHSHGERWFAVLVKEG